MRPGVCVQIGLDKNVKLSALFHRYVNFCNEAAKQTELSGGGSHRTIQYTDLEFVHSTVLNETDTAENAGLMKNDRIMIRKERGAERQRDESFHKEHRESDKLYFEQMLKLLDTNSLRIEASNKSKNIQNLSPPDRMYADVLLECEAPPLSLKGVVIPTQFPNNYVDGSSFLRCHSVIISKRCPWLGDMIQDARKLHLERTERRIEEEKSKQQARQSIVTVPEILDTQESEGIDINDSQLTNQGECMSFSSNPNRDEEEQEHTKHSVLARDHIRQWISHGSNEFDDGILDLNNAEVGRDLHLDQEEQNLDNSIDYMVTMPAAQIDASDDEDDIQNFQMSNAMGQRPQNQIANDSAKVWTDDCDEESAVFVPRIRRSSNAYAPIKTAGTNSSPLVVQINNHPAPAMQLLLEYCYSNRVASLGYEAFEQSCRTKRTSSSSRRNQGNGNPSSPSSSLPNWPVSPFSSKNQRWPNNGEPTVTFEVVIAGMKLAEEARLYRLSFMCEVAASQLLNSSMHHGSLITPSSLRVAIKALEICEDFNELYKNPLPRLRLAATHTVVHCLRKRTSNAFTVQNALTRDAIGSRLVSPLLTGIMDAIEESNATAVSSQHKSSKRKIHGLPVGFFPSTIDYHNKDWPIANADSFFNRIDREEAAERESERRKRRLETQTRLGRDLEAPTNALGLANNSTANRLRGTIANRVFSADEDISQENSSSLGASYVGEGATIKRKRIRLNMDPHLLSHRQQYDIERQVASSTLKRLSAHHHDVYLTHQSLTRSSAPPAAGVASSLPFPPDAVGSSRLEETTTTTTSTTTTTTKKSSSSRTRSSSSNNHNQNSSRGPR